MIVGFRAVFAYYILTLAVCASPDFSLARGMTVKCLSRVFLEKPGRATKMAFRSSCYEREESMAWVYVFVAGGRGAVLAISRVD